MSLNNKEEKLKALLGVDDFDLEVGEVWSDINFRLDERDRKKKRRVFPFLILAILLPVCMMLAYSYSSNSTKLANQSSKLSQSVGVHKITETEDSNKQDSSIEYEKLESKQTTLPKDEILSRLENEKSSTNRTLNNSNSKTKLKQTGNSISSSRIKDINRESAVRGTSSIVNKKLVPAIQTESITNENSIPKTNLSNSLNSTGIGGELIEDAGLIQIQKIPLIAVVESVNSSKLVLWLKTQKRSSEPILIEKTSPSRWTIGLAAGVLGVQSSLELNDLMDSEIPKAFIQDENLTGVQADLLIARALTEKWNLFAGLSYTKRVAKYDNSYRINSSQESAGIEYYEEDEDGIQTPVIGNILSSDYTNYDVLWHRQHDEVDFVLGVSTELLKASRFNISPELSLTYNIISKLRGYFFENELNAFKVIKEETENPYAKNSGLKMQLGIACSYDFGSTSIFVKGNYRHYLNDLTKETNFYTIKNNHGALMLGMTYRPSW